MDNLLGKVFSVLMSRGLLKMSGLISFLVLARILGAEGFGLFGVFSSAAFVVAAVGNLGIRQSGAYVIGQDTFSVGQVRRAMMLMWIPLALVSTVVVLLMIWGSTQGGIVTWIGPTLTAVAGIVLLTLFQGIFLGAGQIGAFNVSEVTPRLVLLLGVALFWWLGTLELMAAVWTFAVGYVLAAFLSVWKASTLGRNISAPHRRTSKNVIGQLVARGWPYAVTLGLILLNSRLSVFLLARLSQPEAAGHFFAGVRMNEIFLESATALGLVFFSHSVQSKDTRETLAQTSAITRWLVATMVGTTIATILLAPILIPPLLGSEFIEAVTILQVLALGLPFVALNRVLYQTIAGLGAPLVGAAAYLPAASLNLGLSLVLIAPMGATGAGIALVVSHAVVSGVLLSYAYVNYRMSPLFFVLLSSSDITAMRRASRSLLDRMRD